MDKQDKREEKYRRIKEGKRLANKALEDVKDELKERDKQAELRKESLRNQQERELKKTCDSRKQHV